MVGFGLFAAAWWVAEQRAHLDRSSALTIAGFVAGPLLAGLTVWAGDRPAVAEDPKTTEAGWPDPRAVKTARDYYAALTRTWIRAGSPAAEEVGRRTGGRVRELSTLLDYDGDPDNKIDWSSTSLLLESMDLPRQLIAQWRGAAVRAERVRLRQYEFDEREERAGNREAYASHWRLTTAVAAAGFLVLYAFVGAGVSQLAVPHLGTGNFVALGLSAIVLIAVSWLIMELSMFWHGQTVRNFVIACCFVGLAAGFAVAHQRVGLGTSIDYSHVGLVVRNWLAWRF
ncbi:hypothetical protein [Hamadaea tsunoensis]|uniref:hypothetical protein n=1 Tax=Hamadaea tsunoensis TaxID=53368 RepID=UPI0004223358|nr:hypothetical protein [Hamadaea tsunoensis]